MRTYSYRVVVEPDEDFDGNPKGWHAYCPALERQGASTWGATESEALQNINALVQMVVESMMEHGERRGNEMEGLFLFAFGILNLPALLRVGVALTLVVLDVWGGRYKQQTVLRLLARGASPFHSGAGPRHSSIS